ncbi:nitric oxide associated protein 1 [Sorochytrium milnesiophthora]
MLLRQLLTLPRRRLHVSAFDVLQSKCPGCGAGFQNETPGRPGFIPQKKLDALSAAASQEQPTTRQQNEQMVCHRCYNIKHQKRCDVPIKLVTPQDLTLGSAHRSLFILLNDLLDFPATHVDLKSVLPARAHVLHVFTKADLLPLDTRYDRVQRWAEHWKQRLNLPSLTPPSQSRSSDAVQDVHVVSSKNGRGMWELFQAVREAKLRYDLRDVYLIGCTNVGKSEFINCWHRMAQIPKDQSQNATTSLFPGTTATNLPVPLARFSKLLGGDDDGLGDLVASSRGGGRLIDTPGMYNKHQLVHLLESHEELSTAVPGQRLVPVTYRIPVNRVVCLGSLAWIHYYDTSLGWRRRSSEADAEADADDPELYQEAGWSRINLTVWRSHKLAVHVTSPEKLEKYQTMLREGKPSVLVPPMGPTLTLKKRRLHKKGQDEKGRALAEAATAERIRRWPEMKVGDNADITVRGDSWERAWADIVIGGVGWVSISGKFDQASFRVWTPGGVGVFRRDPLMPFDFGKIIKTP